MADKASRRPYIIVCFMMQKSSLFLISFETLQKCRDRKVFKKLSSLVYGG